MPFYTDPWLICTDNIYALICTVLINLRFYLSPSVSIEVWYKKSAKEYWKIDSKAIHPVITEMCLVFLTDKKSERHSNIGMFFQFYALNTNSDYRIPAEIFEAYTKPQICS